MWKQAWRIAEMRWQAAISSAPPANAQRETSMRVTELPHVLGASEGYDPRGNILRIVTDLPLRAGMPGHNAKKLVEEAVEALIEGIRGDKPKLVGESADMLYHLLTLW